MTSPSVDYVAENGIERHRVLGTRICYEPSHAGYTRGIEIQQVAFSGELVVDSVSMCC